MIRTPRTALSLALAALLLPACAGTSEVDAAAPASVPSWGAPIEAAAPMTLTELLDRADELDGQELAVTGTIAEVCQMKGCWLVLTDGERQMRVRFFDYAFFVPMDLTGDVVIEGTFTIKLQSEDELKHYLEDAGRYEEAEAVSGPQRGFTFLANGVRQA